MRDGKLDFFKAFLIWSVVVGHCMNVLSPYYNELHIILRLFDLPMFMYISGFLLKGSIARYCYRQLLVNKLTTIAFPAIIWMVLSFLLGDPHLYYFLWAILVSSVIVMTCRKLFPQKISIVLMITVAVAFHLIPWNIVNISFLFPFFLIGYFSRQISHVGRKVGVASLVLFVLLRVIAWQPEYTIWISGGYVLHNTLHMLYVVILRIVLGVSGIYAATFVLGWLYDKVRESHFLKLWENIGKETLAIYLMQHIVVEIGLLKLILCLEVNAVLDKYPLFAGYLLSPVISLVLLILIYKAANVLRKSSYLKWVFGLKILHKK